MIQTLLKKKVTVSPVKTRGLLTGLHTANPSWALFIYHHRQARQPFVNAKSQGFMRPWARVDPPRAEC